MGGVLLTIRDPSFRRFHIGLSLLSAALQVMIFGDVEVVIDRAKVTPATRNR